jgi:hypothetical protein
MKSLMIKVFTQNRYRFADPRARASEILQNNERRDNRTDIAQNPYGQLNNSGLMPNNSVANIRDTKRSMRNAINNTISGNHPEHATNRYPY